MLNKREIEKYLAAQELFIRPFNKKHLKDCYVNLCTSENHARLIKSNEVVDLKQAKDLYRLRHKQFDYKKSSSYVVCYKEHVLIETLEYLEFPKYLTGFVILNNKFANLGLKMQPIFIPPNFKGVLLLHVTGTVFPIRLHAKVPIFKMILAKTSNSTISIADQTISKTNYW